jgi:hypothetical protein
MTKKEALLSIIPFEVSDNLVEKALIDSEINGSETYSKASEQDIDLCFAGLILVILNMPDYSEGDLSIKIDRVQLRITRDNILKKYGLDESNIDCESIW